MRDNVKKILNHIVEELCRRVKAPYPPPDATKYDVDDFTWTEEELENFRKWLSDYLYSIPMFKRRGKKYIAKEVEYFIFQYGWDYDKETKKTEEQDDHRC
jgi:hypothetical protein